MNQTVKDAAATLQARIIHERLTQSRGSFPPIRRQASSAMHNGIACVGLPGLDEKSLAGHPVRRRYDKSGHRGSDSYTLRGRCAVFVNNPG
jgi:hypothetical protein